MLRNLSFIWGVLSFFVSCKSEEMHWGYFLSLIYWIFVGFLSSYFYLRLQAQKFRYYSYSILITFVIYTYIFFQISSSLEIQILPLLIFLPAFFFAKVLKKESKKKHEEYQRVFRENKSIRMDMNLAKNIQESLFPKLEKIKGIEYDVHRQIQNQIGGDFFDFVKLREGNIGIFMTDVAGHGVSSAMVAAMLKVMVSTIPYVYKIDPSGLLTYLDTKMANDYKSEHATAIYLFINFQSKTIYLANAGHPYLLYQKKGDIFREVQTEGSLLGYGIRQPIADNIVLNFESGDRFFIYTDGLIEDVNPEGEYLTTEGLIRILNQIKDEPTESFKKRLLVEITGFYKKSLFTDDTMFLICEME